jgi:acetolactate synthase-1/2/3 large subunit
MVDAATLAAAQLAREGVGVVFSLSGGHITPLWRALAEAGIRIVDVRHEDAAVHMAQAYERIGGGLGVACATAGPGVTNTVTAVATASAAASPVLLIGGRAPVAQFDLGAFQDVDQPAILRPLTKSAHIVLEGGRVCEYLSAALRVAHTPPFGPAYVEIPADVLRQTIEVEAAQERTVAPARLEARLPPSPDALAAALRLLEQAERPVILAGSGLHWSNGFAELRACAETLAAPVLTTALARGALPRSHPLNLYAARSYLLSNADVVLVVGTRFNFVTGYGRPPRFAEEAAVIQIDLAASELNRNRTATVAVHADASAALSAITAATGPGARLRPWLEDAREHHERARGLVEQQSGSDSRPVHPLRLCAEAVSNLSENTVFVADGGDILSFARVAVQPTSPGCYLDPGPYGALGAGLPFAIAAKLARPDAPVACITGDGALGMNVMELDTAVRHGIPVLVLVSNNSAWGIERNSQIVDFEDATGLGTLLRDCRFDLVAQALGCYGERVEDPAELGGAIVRALESGVPALVDVVTDVDAVSPDLRRGLARVPDRQPLVAYGSTQQ